MTMTISPISTTSVYSTVLSSAAQTGDKEAPGIDKDNLILKKIGKCGDTPKYTLTVPLKRAADEFEKSRLIIHTDIDHNQSEAEKTTGMDKLFFPWVCLDHSLNGEEDGEYAYIKFVTIGDAKLVKSEIFPIHRPGDPEGY